MLESFARKWFGKNISKLLLGVEVENVDLVTFVFLADEVVFGLDVLGAFMVFGVFNELNGTLIVREEGSRFGGRKTKACK